MLDSKHLPVVNPMNARNLEYRAQLEMINASGQCPFCPNGLTLNDPDETRLIILENDYWIVKHNRHPLTGSRVHLVLIPKIHVTSAKNLPNEFRNELFSIINQMDRQFNATGSVVYFRQGDTNVTGATVHHMHAQYLVPDNHQLVNVTFGQPPTDS
jgi:diadenosine tetraphosphate (Ap4A) HIT family hydrolase